jgi:hypothetical protein
MNLKEAISILRIHNAWRKGEEIEQLAPKDISAAIDIVIKNHETNVEPAKYCSLCGSPKGKTHKTWCRKFNHSNS